MTRLIEAKVAGEEIVTVPDPEEPKVIHLLEALKQSIANAKVEVKAEKSAGVKKTAASAGITTGPAKKTAKNVAKKKTSAKATQAKTTKKMAPSTKPTRKKKSG